jgi:putative hydroxymethylpyrimidine transport system substrate-binding protein
VLVAHPDLVRERGADVAAFLDGLQESIDATRRSPDEALAAFFRAFPELDDELDRRSFTATLPLYAESVRLDDPTTWDNVQRFLVDAGLLGGETPFASLVATDLVFTGP